MYLKNQTIFQLKFSETKSILAAGINLIAKNVKSYLASKVVKWLSSISKN